MKITILAAASFAASVAAQGCAVVVNNCDYDVWMFNTPSDDGVAVEDDAIISANGGKYSTQYKTLKNGMGWSLKVGNASTLVPGEHFQFEYTWTGDDRIWYDLSEIDGDPWAGNWGITSDDSTCMPSVQKFFAAGQTTDPNGMQTDCAVSASVTVSLCSNSGSSSSGSSSSSIISSAAAASSTTEAASTSTSVAPTTTEEASSSSSSLAEYSTSAVSITSATEAATSTSASSSTRSHSWHSYKEAAAALTTASPTTFATAVITSASSVDSGDVVFTVTEVATAYATVVETIGAKKRDSHHHHHAARHPHAGRA